jgi:tripartite-type tricarboxylate transporter receptor subunit TctC
MVRKYNSCKSLKRFLCAGIQKWTSVLRYSAIALALLSFSNLESAFAQAPFYQGKTIRIIVGYQSGDSHDQWARTYARFLGKHIPGNPGFVVQNMPGAGSMIAANHVYNLAKPDGLTLGSIGGALFMAQITGRKEVKFDWPKFSWIMTPERGGHLLYMRSDIPHKTFDDLRQTNDPPKCSATGVGSSGYDIPRLLGESLGFKFQVISGYPGGAEQDLAMERGEVQCRAITIDAFFGREPFRTWMKQGFVKVWLQTERTRNAKLPDVPTIFELMDKHKVSEPKRRLVESYLGIWGFGSRPIVTTPGVPADRVKLLRSAFAQMFDDPEFSDELKKRRWEVRPVGGEELQALAKQVVDQPPEIEAALKRLLSK